MFDASVLQNGSQTAAHSGNCPARRCWCPVSALTLVQRLPSGSFPHGFGYWRHNDHQLCSRFAGLLCIFVLNSISQPVVCGSLPFTAVFNRDQTEHALLYWVVDRRNTNANRKSYRGNETASYNVLPPGNNCYCMVSVCFLIF